MNPLDCYLCCGCDMRRPPFDHEAPRKFSNPICFSINSIKANLFPMSAHTEDDVWESVYTGFWLVKRRDVCELHAAFCTHPVYLAVFFGQYFQGVAQMMSLTNLCGECRVRWWYVKDIPMIDFFCITSCFTYKHMLRLSKNLVRKFLLHFHCFRSPPSPDCCPCAKLEEESQPGIPCEDPADDGDVLEEAPLAEGEVGKQEDDKGGDGDAEKRAPSNQAAPKGANKPHKK